MLVENKVAIVYGAGGAMGAAVARRLAAEGAAVHLAGRTGSTLDGVAGDIRTAGGRVETRVVDVDDPGAVDAHVAHVAEASGRVDVMVNTTGMDAVQDVPLVELALADFLQPIVDSARRQFNTATAAARQMVRQGSGTIVTLASTATMETRYRMGGFNLACAGVEAFTRGLAGEVGRSGVRVVCVRPNFTPETTGRRFEEWSAEEQAGLGRLVDDTILGRLPYLSEVAGTIAFAASDAAGAITGSVINASCGAVAD